MLSNNVQPIKMRAAKLPPVDDVSGLVEPIVRHVREVLARGDPVATEFVLDFMCHIIQNPTTPLRFALILHGACGCGKDILFQFLRSKVIGINGAPTLATAAPLRNILLNTQRERKNYYALVQLAEGFHAHMRTLSKVLQNRDNVTAVVCTTNHVCDAVIAPKDVDTFPILRCAPTPPHDYFRSLFPHLERNDVARAFYQYAMARNLQRVNDTPLCRLAPGYLARTAKETRFTCFLSALVNAAPAAPVLSCTLLEQFKRFAGGTFPMSQAKFGRQIRSFPQCKPVVIRGRVAYSVDVDALRDVLVYYNLFDAKATLA